MPYIIDYRNRLSCLQRRRRLPLQLLPRIALRARGRGVLYNQTFPLSGRKGNGIRGGFALDTTGVRGVGIRGGLALESFRCSLEKAERRAKVGHVVMARIDLS